MAIILEAVAVGLSASPPLDGSALVAAYFGFFWIVLAGPLFLFDFVELKREPIFLAGLFFGAFSVAILLSNRNRSKLLIILSGLLWCSAGAIAIWIGISVTV